jgi:2,3-bisphosphoglycerate-independent phosphoglycerate mutase
MHKVAALSPHPSLSPKQGPIAVIVLDGVGCGVKDEFDAVYRAKTPHLDGLLADEERSCTLRAHGTAVGLPTDDDMGNSEVGHNALGAGRVVMQGAALVDKALQDGSLFAGEGWAFLKERFASGGTLHLLGLLSDGGVHSRLDQLLALLDGAAREGAKRLRVHALTDGRDVQEGSAVAFTEQLEDKLGALRAAGLDARIASGGGRMVVTMDRYEADWSVVERGWRAHVLGEGRPVHSMREALDTFRVEDPDVSDQSYPPFVVTDAQGQPVGTIEDGDAVLCFNFRGDRVIQISRAFEEERFEPFERGRMPRVHYAGMMEYDGDLHIPRRSLVAPPQIERTSGEYLAASGVRTFAVSETQKFGHVTYFWNGNRSGKFGPELETYQEIPSDRVSFDKAPAMKAMEIAEVAAQALRSGRYDLVRLNIANGDMVGHTGKLEATIESMEVVDRALGVLLAAVQEAGGTYIVTADHGNADDMAMRDKKGEPLRARDGCVLGKTSHTLAPVPFAVGGPGLPTGARVRKDLAAPGLANVTATFINLLGFEAPEDYEPSLLAFEVPR